MSADDVVARLADGAEMAATKHDIAQSVPVALAGSKAMWRASRGDAGLLHIAVCRLAASSAAALATTTEATWDQVEETTVALFRGFLQLMRSDDEPR